MRKKTKTAAWTMLELLIVTTVIVVLGTAAAYWNHDAESKALHQATVQRIELVNTAKSSFYNDPTTTVIMQTIFDAAQTSNSDRLSNIAPFLTIGGATPTSTAQIAAGTSGTECIIGSIATGAVIQ